MSQLLYKPERGQYEQLIREEPNMVPCKTYGVVHLLRLFTKLGEMLIYTPLSEKSINLLLFYVNDMLMYMKRNASLIFSLAGMILTLCWIGWHMKQRDSFDLLR